MWFEFSKAVLKKLKVAYKNSLRRFMFLRWRNSATEMFVNLGIHPFDEMLRIFVFSFCSGVTTSHNQLICSLCSAHCSVYLQTFNNKYICLFQMENIAYDLFKTTMSRTIPGFHSFSYQKHNIHDLSISHYVSVQIMYKHLNRVWYTKLKLDTTDESCARFKFYSGYHTGGKDKLKIQGVQGQLQLRNSLKKSCVI